MLHPLRGEKHLMERFKVRLAAVVFAVFAIDSTVGQMRV